MKIVIPPDFLSIVKDSFILLDTNIFVDAYIHPKEFRKFFDELKHAGVEIVTLPVVKFEFLKGSSTDRKLREKNDFIEEIIDSYLPITDDVLGNVDDLVRRYKEEGKAVSITDLLLGGVLVKYPTNVLLVTKDLSDFPTNIFERKTYFQLFHRRAIHNYGVYSWEK